LLAAPPGDADWAFARASAPDDYRPLTGAELDNALAIVGDWVDLKSAWFTGHSAGVAALADAAARELGLSTEARATVRRAAYLHDIGRAGVSSLIWDKPGQLTPAERERVRLHSYYTERMLVDASPLAAIGRVAAMAHERLDGSGYHRGLTATDIGIEARVLAAADAYHTKLEARPHRAALTPKDAAAYLTAEVKAGRLDGAAADAVLRVGGHPTTGAPRPAGLTAREAEVLVLLARGMTNKQIAKALVISPKTVSNHVEHIYAKAQVSTRAAATLFAMQHRLVDPVGTSVT
jgi:HD-GYP domain-containing protein (c-di-GMP phosphodiesterase class II)/DNA-binding CsgD family transcriptional regulator